MRRLLLALALAGVTGCVPADTSKGSKPTVSVPVSPDLSSRPGGPPPSADPTERLKWSALEMERIARAGRSDDDLKLIEPFMPTAEEVAVAFPTKPKEAQAVVATAKAELWKLLLEVWKNPAFPRKVPQSASVSDLRADKSPTDSDKKLLALLSPDVRAYSVTIRFETSSEGSPVWLEIQGRWVMLPGGSYDLVKALDPDPSDKK